MSAISRSRPTPGNCRPARSAGSRWHPLPRSNRWRRYGRPDVFPTRQHDQVPGLMQQRMHRRVVACIHGRADDAGFLVAPEAAGNRLAGQARAATAGQDERAGRVGASKPICPAASRWRRGRGSGEGWRWGMACGLAARMAGRVRRASEAGRRWSPGDHAAITAWQRSARSWLRSWPPACLPAR